LIASTSGPHNHMYAKILAEPVRRGPLMSRWMRTLVILACIPFLISFATATSAAGRKTLSVEPLATQSVVPGETAHFPFLVRNAGRFESVKFEVGGLPPSVSARFLSGGSGRYELSLDVAVDASPGLSTIKIRVRSLREVKVLSVYLEIVARTVVMELDALVTEDLELEVGETVNVIFGDGSPLRADRGPSLGVRGLPSGVSVDFANNDRKYSGFSLTASRSALPGEYQLEIVEFGETFSRSYLVTLRIVDGEWLPPNV
jgi:hypothetical protein